MFKHLFQPVRRVPYSANAKMASTLLGASGLQYDRGRVLRKNKNGNPTIFQAT